MTPRLWSSKFAAECGNLPTYGNLVPAATDTCCMLCGMPVAKDDLCDPAPLSGSFTNHHDLAARTGVGCQYCGSIKDQQAFIQATVFCRDGALSIGTDRARAWFLTTPPEPPFLAVVGLTKNQSLVWRTPICYSTDCLTMRIGNEIARIRRPYLVKAIEVAKAAAARTQELRRSEKGGPDKDPPNHPYSALSRKLDASDHGRFRMDVLSRAETDAKLAGYLAFLRQATHGELWALATLAKRNPEIPEKPEPIVFSKRNSNNERV